jgi:hypothetical protein
MWEERMKQSVVEENNKRKTITKSKTTVPIYYNRSINKK